MTVPTLLELERIASRGWQGTTVEHLGDWLLRAGGGFTGRANSVLALGSPGVPLDEAVEVIREFYRRQALPPVFQIPFEGSPGAVSLELRAHGWQPFNETAVLVGDLVTAAASFRELPGAVVEADPVPSERWLSGYHYRGRPLPANAIAVLVNADNPAFLSLLRDGDLLGVGRGIVTDGWLGVTAVTVVEAHRRQGVGSALMAALIGWGRRNGAERAYLQVDATNAPALAMYARGGFTEHHRYHYLRTP